MRPLRLGVLVSGRGSNLSAIIKKIANSSLNAEIALVVSDNPNAYALKVAGENKLHFLIIERRNFKSRDDFELKILDELKQHNVDLVVLAGFMRLLGKTFLTHFQNRVINIHPSLLPSFPGLNAQKQALEYGVKISGCTVHFVNEIMDGGRIISQAAVPVLPDDSEETLSARILVEEHRLLPEVIAQLGAALLQDMTADKVTQ